MNPHQRDRQARELEYAGQAARGFAYDAHAIYVLRGRHAAHPRRRSGERLAAAPAIDGLPGIAEAGIVHGQRRRRGGDRLAHGPPAVADQPGVSRLNGAVYGNDALWVQARPFGNRDQLWRLDLRTAA